MELGFWKIVKEVSVPQKSQLPWQYTQRYWQLTFSSHWLCVFLFVELCSQNQEKEKDKSRPSSALSKDNLESILHRNDIYVCDTVAYYLPLKTNSFLGNYIILLPIWITPLLWCRDEALQRLFTLSSFAFHTSTKCFDVQIQFLTRHTELAECAQLPTIFSMLHTLGIQFIQSFSSP